MASSAPSSAPAAAAPAAVVHVNSSDEFAAVGKQLAQSNRFGVFEYTAPWCGKCKPLAPKFAALAQQWQDKALFAKVDVDEAEDVSEDNSITALPTFTVTSAKGEELGRHVGSNWTQVLAFLSKHVQGAEPAADDSTATSPRAKKRARRETLRVDLATNRSRVAAFAKAGTAATFAAVEKALHAATRAPTKFTMEELTKLYRFYTPQLGPEGTCSASTKLEETPFCLATAARLTWSAALAKHPFTARQWRLKQIVTALAEAVGAEWCGVYRTVDCVDGTQALMKEAYVGEPSRAFFPLTPEFAAGSNNSTVAMTSTAIIIPDTRVRDDDVAYYVCSTKVETEICAPIVTQEGKVLGIIDVEAWRANHFTQTHIDLVLYTCQRLADANLFMRL